MKIQGPFPPPSLKIRSSEAVVIENLEAWDPMLELTITSPNPVIDCRSPDFHPNYIGKGGGGGGRASPIW
jgi:hypothetical protein